MTKDGPLENPLIGGYTIYGEAVCSPECGVKQVRKNELDYRCNCRDNCSWIFLSFIQDRLHEMKVIVWLLIKYGKAWCASFNSD